MPTSEVGASLVAAPPGEAESRPVAVVVAVVVEAETLVDDELDVSAFATPGADASATPTPSVIASPPTRPMCLA
ncbi:MAG: hypothetical protein K0U76_05780, partial [Actinomycetia bacterium]|nr:hypothetical protein [Actinomycetes bacterium]